MNLPLLALSSLLILYTSYCLIRYTITRIQDARNAKRWGCASVPMRPYKYPLGVDQVMRLLEADKRNQVPNEIQKIYKEMNANTWVQYIFGMPTWVTVDPKNIQALLATQFNDFEIGENRRGNFFPLFGNGIFTQDGKAWEHSRGLLRPQFARDQITDLEMEERHLQNMFLQIVADKSGWTPEVNLVPIFFQLTLDTATEFLFGESVDSLISALPDTAPQKRQMNKSIGMDLAEVARAFDEGTHALGTRARFAEAYWLYNPASFRQNCKIVHSFADYYVNLALQRRSHISNEKDDAKQKYVFLDELAKATQDPVELRSQLLNIFLAGRDTTSGLLGWTFWNLARHPDIFEKLRNTIIENFGTYEKPKPMTFATLKSCTYLQHVMSETLRLFTSVPINSRRAVRATTIPRGGGPTGQDPVYIPKGCQVDYSVDVMHHRKDLWGEDADEFRPERWQGRKAGWEFLPFNGGPRICLGQQFALTEGGYVLARMLQKYDGLENLDPTPENDPRHQFSVTSAPFKVPLRLHEAKNKT